jgi:hypothetical protein
MTEKTKKAAPDNPEQSRRFEEKARELGSDESGKAFEKAFKKIAQRKISSPKRAAGATRGKGR